MIDLSLHEAQLFRICSAFFGEERVLLRMKVLTVCGGSLPTPAERQLSNATPNPTEWAKQNNCLITVVNAEDQPRLVIEFFSGFEKGIDVVELEHQRYLKPILKAAGIQYLTISMQEFNEILNPESNLDFVAWLKANVEIGESEPEEPETGGHV